MSLPLFYMQVVENENISPSFEIQTLYYIFKVALWEVKITFPQANENYTGGQKGLSAFLKIY